MERFFNKDKDEKKEIFSSLKESYMYWRQDLQTLNKPFFMIPTDFKHLFLKDISGGALKLYLYLGFHSKFYTGESWHTIEEIASFLDKDQRTISKWFNELEKLGLIFRAQDGFKRKANTFLRPYGFNLELIETGNITTTKNILDDVKINKELGRNFKFGLILNHALKEYSIILINKEEEGNVHQYQCSCFLNFNIDEIKLLKLELKKSNIFLDNYDVESSIYNSANRKLTIYTNLLKYLDEENK